LHQITKERLAHVAFYLGLAIAIFFGAKLRLEKLDIRPMHVDEAIQAMRFGELLEEGKFEYLPDDGHGPGLLYATLPFAWAKGADTYVETDEVMLRRVPAFFGIAIIALTGFAFRRWLGTPAGIASAFLVAVSPMMSFYSRYYIMETPMVFFLLAFILFAWLYLLSRKLPWLIAAGACGAIMHATKETFGISIIALLLGAVCAVLISLAFNRDLLNWLKERLADPSRLAIHMAIALPISLYFSAVLYSVGFNDTSSIAESYQTYANYLDRGTGEETGHEKPTNYYLELLTKKVMEAEFTWSEAVTLILAGIGIIASFAWPKLSPEKRFLATTLALYTVFSFAFYSLIPYKTPWSIMSSLHAATILAGFGFCAIFHLCRHPAIQVAACIPLFFGVKDLHRQALLANFPTERKMPLYAMENRNPYVYGHTTTGFVKNIVEPLDQLLAVSPDGHSTIIRVVHSEDGWPIPWYFRDYPINPTREIAPVETDSIVITDDAYFDAVQAALGDDYTFTLANLRSDLVIYMFYKQSLFDLAHSDL